MPVFGLLKRGGKVYTKIIPDAKTETLMPILEKKVVPDSIVYSDCWRGYNVLDIAGFKHYRINHSQLFADRQNHINGIENPRLREGVLLEPSQAAYAEIQRYSATVFWLVFEGV